MDAFHEEYVVLFHLHEVACEMPAPFLEVESRQFHPFSVEQGVQLAAEEVKIHGSEGLEVVFSVLVLRRILPVHEIIVEFYHFRVQAEHLALDGEPLRR